jgi:hypothetical protein
VLISMMLNRKFCTAENCIAGANLFWRKVLVKMYISEYTTVVCWSLAKKLQYWSVPWTTNETTFHLCVAQN